MTKIYRGRHLTSYGDLPLSCAETAELFPDIFPVDNNYGDTFTAAAFAACCGSVELLPSGALMWKPPQGRGDDSRFDNVSCFIAGRSSRRWRKIPEL